MPARVSKKRAQAVVQMLDATRAAHWPQRSREIPNDLHGRFQPMQCGDGSGEAADRTVNWLRSEPRAQLL